jgi:hypothetical protein
MRNLLEGEAMTETTTVSPAAAGPASAPGLFARIVGVVFSPHETFAAVAARPRWLGVMAITLAIAAAAQYVILSSPALQDAIIDQQIRAMERNGATASDAQIQGVETFIGYLPVVYAAVTPIVGPLFAHSGVISTLSAVLSATLVLAGVPPNGPRPPGANLGVFAPMLEETSFLAVMLMSIDLILVWWVITLAIGLGVLYKRRTGGIATTLLGVYLVIAILIATFTSGS